MPQTSPLRLTLAAATLAGTGLPLALPAVDYESDIRPLFEANCIKCHGPEKQKAELRLDQRASLLKGGDTGLPAIVPGDTDASYLIEVIDGSDPDIAMPPKGDPLTADQVALVTEWIADGAQWPGQMDDRAELTTDLWSFQPVVRPDVPAGAANPVDAFLDRKLAAADIEPNNPASPQDLIRRASVILTGLPPTHERTQRFVAAYAENPDAAYGTLVDELLASPHFGERWAQHWLDAIRWAETNGSEANLYRKNAWIYRDYVVRAFNEDRPYNRFVTDQLAGDRTGAGEATGFLVAGPHVPAATVGREPSAIRQARADRMDEIMQTVGASIMGVTVSCARCHNHKFDPVSIKDYYALSAVFQGVEFGGRWPEFAEDHPRKQRAKELYKDITAERKKLRSSAGQWLEDWGGFHDLTFPVTETKALRLDFDWKNVGLDELDVYGPADYTHNLALASRGTTLKTDPAHTKKGNGVHKANDGEVGTMAWRTAVPKNSKQKPWLEVHFDSAKKVNRVRLSSNREYYFETDYLAINNPTPPAFKLSALQPDGTWKEVGKTGWAKALLERDPELKAASERLHDLLGQLAEEGPRHSFVGKFKRQPPVTHVLHRGSPENPRDEVAPAGFDILGGALGLASDTPDPQRRTRFAKWLTSPDHPLTARVMVNRLWHHTFGAGIVTTTSDFGTAGAKPSHPELLDWLAAEFVKPSNPNRTPWSVKSMLRLLVTSDAFRRSSLPDDAKLEADATASLLWRYPPRRVEAEVLRDGLLQASGKLDPTIGGRGFRIHNVKKTYAQWQVTDNHGPHTWRRMLYQERMRRVDDQMFTAFDFPDCGQVRAKRPVSTTPLQALNLMNSAFVVEQSEFLAERAKAEAGDGADAALRRLFELVLARAPDTSELDACRDTDLHLVARALINSNEFAFLP